MAKMYYNLEETLARLGVTEDQLRGMVRAGKLREFRDAGKLNYRVDEVDRVASGTGTGEHVLGGSGELALEDAEISLSPGDSGGAAAPSGSGGLPGLSGSDIPIDLSGSDTGAALAGTGSGTAPIQLDDSKTGSSGGTSALRLEDSGAGEPAGAGSDAMTLDEVDKGVVEGMKKDDTVITNIGISVFDDDDLEIAADPMAKTMVSGGDEHLGLDGSGGGSGLLDLTRESDDTSLGAELLEGIDMGDTAETMAQSAATEAEEAPSAADEPALPAPGLEPAVALVPVQMVGVTEAVSPAFTGLLAAAAIVLFLAGATAVAVSISEYALPSYLTMMADNFWFMLGGAVLMGGLFALVGYLMGRPSTPKAPRPPKEKKAKEKKPKKGAAATA